MPATADVTVTVIVQTLFADKVPPENETLVSPPASTGEKAPAPHPLNVTPGVLCTAKPAGKVSVKLTPVKVSVVRLVNLNDMTEVPPGEIAFGVNVFWIVTLEGPIIDAKRAPVEKSAL